ncbi:MAG: prepilin-type N-terminal cleavage/methylation domain-containing protein [Deltaproteobacteria bacterium]|nr:prepilin-type N-terminal cleavage/methylation domain-containing protein [Deltaproteobacteria bacterium]
MRKELTHNDGFTLIELLIAIAIFGTVLAGVYGALQGQLKSHYTQQETMEMQQNIRASLYLMTRELKMAGLDPSANADADILTADSHTVTFSMDFIGGANDGLDNDGDGDVDEGNDVLNNNGTLRDGITQLIDEPDEDEWYDGRTDDDNEEIAYILGNDADNDGINDGLPTENNDRGTCDLIRIRDPLGVAPIREILAQNIDALNFVYLDENGAPLATPVADTSLIRSVQISIVARSGPWVSDLSYTFFNNQAYQDQQGAVFLPAQNDNFRRMLITTEVRCRNLGL